MAALNVQKNDATIPMGYFYQQVSSGQGDNSTLFVNQASSTSTDKILRLRSASVDRVTVMGDGSIGIGITNPASPLVTSSTQSATLNSNSGVTINMQGASNNQYTTLGFSWAQSTSSQAPIAGISFRGTSYASGQGDLAFFTNSGQERLTLQNGGNVGIGTTGPLDGLDVSAGAGVTQPLNSYFGSNVYYAGGGWKYRANGVGGAIKMADTGNNAFNIYTFASNSAGVGASATSIVDALTILPGGNVGIGTSAPGVSRVYIKGGALDDGSGATYGLGLASGMSAGRFTSNSANNSASINTYWNDSSIELAAGLAGGAGLTVTGSGAASNAKTIQMFTNNSERLRVDSSGNVGIGISIPIS